MAKYGPRPRPAEDRFWDHVTPLGPDQCWEWQGARMNGYGFLHGGEGRPRWVKAHRLSWEIHVGVPEANVLHHCDNPPCVNPAHLFSGTNLDNARDRDAKGRGGVSRGTDNGRATLTDADVVAIIALLRTGRPQAKVAAIFGIKQPQVSRIARGESWGHLVAE